MLPYVANYKTLSLLQPWGSLVAVGAKRIETRSWSTKHRGPLAIHASMGDLKTIREISQAEPFYSVLRLCDAEAVGELPRGEVVATVTLLDCVQIGRNLDLGRWNNLLVGFEAELGNFTPGRFAWILDEPLLVKQGVGKAKGTLGLWDWKAPEFGGWRRRPWWVGCLNPDCLSKSRTLVGIRAREWAAGICPECWERRGRMRLPQHTFALPGLVEYAGPNH